MSIIRIQPKTGDVRSVDIELAKMSNTLRDMIESGVSDTGVALPLPQITEAALDKVLEWLSYHSNDPIESEEDSDEDESCAKCAQVINVWDKQFLEMERDLLFDVVNAANFLDIQGLLRIGCKVLAEQLRGKTAEEVRKLWNISCDLSPEEELQIRTANAWTEK